MNLFTKVDTNQQMEELKNWSEHKYSSFLERERMGFFGFDAKTYETTSISVFQIGRFNSVRVVGLLDI